VLLEKQMTLTVEKAADLVSLSRKNGLKLAVAFHNPSRKEAPILRDGEELRHPFIH
jgi:predicted dehydrogenase